MQRLLPQLTAAALLLATALPGSAWAGAAFNQTLKRQGISVMAEVVIGDQDSGLSKISASRCQGPLTDVAIRVLPSSESARPRNALTAGSGGLR